MNDDKTKYGVAGPWDNEPDQEHFEHMGYPCKMKRNGTGIWCGYVGVPESHPWHGKKYTDDVPVSQGTIDRQFDMEKVSTLSMLCQDQNELESGSLQICLAVNAHGGLTYSGAGPNDSGHSDWYFGFDCGHYGDLIPKFLADKIAFDGDYRNAEYVRDECKNLAVQLAAFDSRCNVGGDDE